MKRRQHRHLLPLAFSLALTATGVVRAEESAPPAAHAEAPAAGHAETPAETPAGHGATPPPAEAQASSAGHEAAAVPAEALPLVPPDESGDTVPYKMLRSLQFVQDSVVLGDHSASEMQRFMLGTIDKRLRAVDPAVFDDERRQSADAGISGGA
jgi:chemotaxis protein MotC